jgi:alkylation response protein AidB-like acyl-CoA dehydrogenase
MRFASCCARLVLQWLRKRISLALVPMQIDQRRVIAVYFVGICGAALEEAACDRLTLGLTALLRTPHRGWPVADAELMLP